jgi:hypothetical protein
MMPKFLENTSKMLGVIAALLYLNIVDLDEFLEFIENVCGGLEGGLEAFGNLVGGLWGT